MGTLQRYFKISVTVAGMMKACRICWDRPNERNSTAMTDTAVSLLTAFLTIATIKVRAYLRVEVPQGQESALWPVLRSALQFATRSPFRDVRVSAR